MSWVLYACIYDSRFWLFVNKKKFNFLETFSKCSLKKILKIVYGILNMFRFSFQLLLWKLFKHVKNNFQKLRVFFFLNLALSNENMFANLLWKLSKITISYRVREKLTLMNLFLSPRQLVRISYFTRMK